MGEHIFTLREIFENVGLNADIFSETLLNNAVRTQNVFDTYVYGKYDYGDDAYDEEGYLIFAKDDPREFLKIYTRGDAEAAYALLSVRFPNDSSSGTLYSIDGEPIVLMKADCIDYDYFDESWTHEP